MSENSAVKERPLSYFVVSLTRAAIVVVTGLVITFNQDHGALFGLVALGIMATVNGVGLALLAWGLPPRDSSRGLHLWQALVSLAVGVLVLALSHGGIVLLLWAIVFWALLTGVAEVFAGWRLAKGSALRRDWIVQGSITVLLALVVMTQSGDSVAVVGFLGSWAIVLGVYLAIAGISQRSAPSLQREVEQ